MPARTATSSRRRPETRRRSPPIHGQPGLLGADPGPTCAQERPDLAADVAADVAVAVACLPCLSTVRALPHGLGVPASTPLSRVCHLAAPAGYVDSAAVKTRAASTSTRGKCTHMTDKKVWLITGAGRGMGVDIAKAALAAGHAVVATGRNAERRHRGPRRARRPAGRQARRHRPRRRRGRRRRPRSNGSAASTCWSTTPATSTPGSSRRSAPRTSGRRSRPPCSARSTSPARCFRSCAPSAPACVVTISSTAGIVGPGVLHRLRRLQVRRRGLDRVADPRGRAVRHPHDARRARLLPHRAAHAGVDAATPSPRSTTTPSAPSRPSPPGTA